MDKRPAQDFSPKLFVVGRRNRLISPVLELLLEEEQDRFGVKSAGMESVGTLHPNFVTFLDTYESEMVDPESFRSTPISVALDDHVKLVAYVSSTVKQEAPIIATTGDTLTLETDGFRSRLEEADDPETFRKVLDEMRNRLVPEILQPLGLQS